MAWTDSRVFRALPGHMFAATANGRNWQSGNTGVKAALYGTGVTPDKDATLANSAYGQAAGVWTTGAEITGGAGQWDAGGRQLTLVNADTSSTGVCKLDAADTASGTTANIAAAFGCIVYDSAITSYGYSFNYFGGTNSVTNGTFTIVWHANGVLQLTV